MSRLSAFLHPVSTKEEKEVVVSRRFQDENGEPVPFKIRALTQEENEALVRASRHPKKKGSGTWEEELDPMELSARVVVAATVEPDFSSKELCDAYGVLDPVLVPRKMLLTGEYGALLQAINDLSGFGKLEYEVKN